MSDTIPNIMQIENYAESSLEQNVGINKTNVQTQNIEDSCYNMTADDAYTEEKGNKHIQELFNNIGSSYNQLRKYESRNSFDSINFNSRRDRSRDRSRDYEIWVYPDELYPIFNPETMLNNSNLEFGYKDMSVANLLEQADLPESYADDATGRKDE